MEALAKGGHHCHVIADARQNREHYLDQFRSRGVKPKAVNIDVGSTIAARFAPL
jgi:hypothetical protein